MDTIIEAKIDTVEEEDIRIKETEEDLSVESAATQIIKQVNVSSVNTAKEEDTQPHIATSRKEMRRGNKISMTIKVTDLKERVCGIEVKVMREIELTESLIEEEFSMATHTFQ